MELLLAPALSLMLSKKEEEQEAVPQIKLAKEQPSSDIADLKIAYYLISEERQLLQFQKPLKTRRNLSQIKSFQGFSAIGKVFGRKFSEYFFSRRSTKLLTRKVSREVCHST